MDSVIVSSNKSNSSLGQEISGKNLDFSGLLYKSI